MAVGFTDIPVAERVKTFVKRQVRRTPVAPLIKRSPIWPLMRPRRFHLYCIGAPRTGTTSIAWLFMKNYRAQHEPRVAELVEVIEAVSNNGSSRHELFRFLFEHDREFRLELESSHPMAMFCDVLVQAFPDAKFILTVRDCYSWVDSMINQHLHSFHDPNLPVCWRRLNDIYYRRDSGSFAPAERVLERLGLYTLDGYLSFWAAHYQRVLNAVPEDRMLILRTDRISHEIERIARFAGVSPDTLDVSKRHAHKVQKKHHIVEQIDQHYLAEKVEEHCRDMMRRFFPERI